MPTHKPQNSRIPVMAGPRLVELADPARVLALLQAPNVRPILRHKKILVEIQLLDFGGAAARVPAKWGNPQKLSTDLESFDNPARVWKLKTLPGRGSVCW